MKQLFINIGFITILFALTLNINYCKKNNTIEPEPENPIKITGTISNNITEQSNNGNPENTLDVEINDTIHVIAKGTADHENSDGFDTFRGGLYENGDRVRFLQLTGSLDGDGNIEYVLNLEGNEKMNFKNTFDGKKLDVMIEYHIRGDYEYKYHKIGEINIKAEKDYSWGTEKNQTIYDNREAIAEILDRNAWFHGEKKDKKFFLDTIAFVYNPNNPRVTETRLEDTFPGNNFKIIAGNSATFESLTEKDLYDILQIIGE